MLVKSCLQHLNTDLPTMPLNPEWWTSCPSQPPSSGIAPLTMEAPLSLSPIPLPSPTPPPSSPSPTSNTAHSTAGQCRPSTSFTLVPQLTAPSAQMIQVSVHGACKHCLLNFTNIMLIFSANFVMKFMHLFIIILVSCETSVGK